MNHVKSEDYKMFEISEFPDNQYFEIKVQTVN